MRKQVFLFMALMLMCLPIQGYCAGTTELGRKDFPPVLMYHDIKTVEQNGFDVSLRDFRKQLDWLKEQGYQTLSIDEYVDGVAGNKPFPEKSVLITFDDGYAGVYTYAAPELHARNMKAVFFIFKEGIGKVLPGYPYLTEQQVAELNADPLFSLQSHTLTHPDLTAMSPEQLRAEVADSKQYMESVTGKPCRALAFPYGYYDEKVLAAVKQAGYEAAFSVSDLGLHHNEAGYSIPRIYMGVIMGKENMKLFKYAVANYRHMPAELFRERFGPLPK